MKGKQKRFCHDHDKFHRTATGIANDLQTTLQGFAGDSLATHELRLLASVVHICEDEEWLGVVQILKRRGVVKNGSVPSMWIILKPAL